VFRTLTVLNALGAAEITTRFSCWFFGEVPLLAFIMKFSRFDDQWYHRGPWKYFLDGTFSTRTAWLTEPYSDEQENYGKGRSKSEIAKILLRNVKKRRQAAFHAIGDRTIREFIDAVEEIGKRFPRVKEMRYRLEHAQLIRKEDIPRLKENGICISSQPAALTTPEKDIRLLGEDRAKLAYPYRSLLDAGVHLSFGSDYPGEPVFKPLEIIHLAVNRDGPEKITPLEGLRCYTIESAYVEGRESEKGSIEKGKLADFVVLSEDLTAVDPARIKDIDVLQTIVGGRVVFTHADFEEKLKAEASIAGRRAN
jgi:predicted amidohydrolase YtcJ